MTFCPDPSLYTKKHPQIMQNHGFDTELLSFGHTNLKLIYLQNNTQNELRTKNWKKKRKKKKAAGTQPSEGHVLKSNTELQSKVPRKGSNCAMLFNSPFLYLTLVKIMNQFTALLFFTLKHYMNVTSWMNFMCSLYRNMNLEQFTKFLFRRLDILSELPL